MGNSLKIPVSNQRVFMAGFEPGNGLDLSVVLPGLNYGCERPLLAGVIGLIREPGGDVVTLNFDYNRDGVFLGLSGADQLSMIADDGRAIVGHCLGISDYRSLIVIGKSLGTISMGGLNPGELPENTRLIWLTPSLKGTGLLARMAGFSCPAFSLIGGCDPSVGICHSDRYKAIAELSHVEITGMDHGWEHAEGAGETDRGLACALRALDCWLQDGNG